MSILKYFDDQLMKAHSEAQTADDYKEPYDYDLFRQCKEEFKKRKILQLLKMEYQLENYLKDFSKIETEMKQKLKEKKAEKRFDTYIFLTISPPESAKLKDMVKCMERAVKRKFVTKYHYAFEQRGDTVKNCGKGKHMHLLFKRDLNYKPATIKRDLKNTFKNLFGKHPMTDAVFNWKKCGYEYYLGRLDYIKGKKDDEKLEKVEIDKLFRKLYKLKPIYQN